MTQSTLASVGSVVDQVYVTIGPQFLNRFSEHLYSSPNKAFEELVSNSWDAGASVVHIGMPDDPSEESALIWILDDGESMDINGFRLLWAIASSHKRDNPAPARPQIGKFGIGKLATYVLANELTFICRASDGQIRAVTMDYRRIDQNPSAFGKLQIDELPLDVRLLDADELDELLTQFTGGHHMAKLIHEGVPLHPHEVEWQDEFGGLDTPPPSSNGTWTLALLSSLKEPGKKLQPGWIRWLLRTALPLGSSMSIVFNGAPLAPSKVDAEIADEWVLGENLGIAQITLPDGEVKSVDAYRDPYPHVTIEGILGAVTGRLRLYKDNISGGKSDVLGASNGFHVNILGRVINIDRHDFGLDNLSHSAWAKFRATIRADGLDAALAVNREGVQHSPELQVFQAFLMALFNKTRVAHDAARKAAWPKAGQVLAESWSGVPLQPLLRVVSEGLASVAGLPPFIDASGIIDREEALQQWQQLADDPGQLVEEVAFESLPADVPLVKYDLAGRRIVVNRNHPFTREHSSTHEQQLLLRDSALVELLTQAWMSDLGISDSQIREVQEYKDQTLRLVAQVRRRTGVQIAEMLINATNDSKGLERVVGDALEYLGFVVEPLGQPGEPEGVATAPTTPVEDDTKGSYKFTYDAKSSRTGKATTGNLKTAALARHRKNCGADHVLVVAPDYQSGALQQECESHGITPMRAADLAALLMLAGSVRPLNLNQFRSVFKLSDPDAVGQWVKGLAEEMRSEQCLSLDRLLQALEAIGYQGPNSINVSVIADRIGMMLGIEALPSRKDVAEVVRGLAVLVPSLIRITGGDVFLSTSPQRLRDAILSQISGIPTEYRFGMDELLAASESADA